MKKFELKATMGRKVLLLTHFLFTTEQEKDFLEKILKGDHPGSDMMDAEIEPAVEAAFGKKRLQDEWEIWNSMKTKDYVEKYPDLAIAMALGAVLYGHHPDDWIEFGFEKGIENQIKNELGSFGWKCKRIE